MATAPDLPGNAPDHSNDGRNTMGHIDNRAATTNDMRSEASPIALTTYDVGNYIDFLKTLIGYCDNARHLIEAQVSDDTDYRGPRLISYLADRWQSQLCRMEDAHMGLSQRRDNASFNLLAVGELDSAADDASIINGLIAQCLSREALSDDDQRTISFLLGQMKEHLGMLADHIPPLRQYFLEIPKTAGG